MHRLSVILHSASRVVAVSLLSTLVNVSIIRERIGPFLSFRLLSRTLDLTTYDHPINHGRNDALSLFPV